MEMDHSDIHPEKQRSFVTSSLSSTPTRQAANPHRRNGGGTVKPTAMHAVRKRPKAASNVPKQQRPQIIGRPPSVAATKLGSEPSFRWSGNDGNVVPNILKNHKQQYTKSALTVKNTEQNLKEMQPKFPPSAPGQLHHHERSLKAPITKNSAFSSASVQHDHLALIRPVPQEIANSASNRPSPQTPIVQRQTGHVTAVKSEKSANFIGDMDRTWEVFERLDVAAAAAATLPHRGGVSYAEAAEAATKSEQFMSRLDRWGNEDDIAKDESGEYRRLPFGGFLHAHTDIELAGELAELGVPAADCCWADPELFAELDERYVAETVFLRKWLPKCAPFPRNDTYRTFLRALNKRDPAFNLVW
jgi:hypothetical protein